MAELNKTKARKLTLYGFHVAGEVIFEAENMVILESFFLMLTFISINGIEWLHVWLLKSILLVTLRTLFYSNCMLG